MLSRKLASRLLAYHIKDYVAALARLMEGCRRPFARLCRRRPLPGKTLAAEAGLSSGGNLPRWSACFRNFHVQHSKPLFRPLWVSRATAQTGCHCAVAQQAPGPTSTTACHSCVENSRRAKLARTNPRTPLTPSETLCEEGDCLLHTLSGPLQAKGPARTGFGFAPAAQPRPAGMQC